MNRGTALKWADHLEKFGAIAGYDNSVLSFHGPDGLLWISPVGVLADFLDPEAWRHEYRFHGSREWHGEIIKIPESWLKKCKIKHDSYELYDKFDHVVGRHNSRPLGFILAADWVRENYESI